MPERRASAARAARTLEHKFYFDEAYDLAFYEPAVPQARSSSRSTSSSRCFLASLGELGSGVRAASRRLSSLQTGYVRSTRSRSPPGLAVLAIVFILVTLAVLTHYRPHLPSDRRRALRLDRALADAAGGRRRSAPSSRSPS